MNMVETLEVKSELRRKAQQLRRQADILDAFRESLPDDMERDACLGLHLLVHDVISLDYFPGSQRNANVYRSNQAQQEMGSKIPEDS